MNKHSPTYLLIRFYIQDLLNKHVCVENRYMRTLTHKENYKLFRQFSLLQFVDSNHLLNLLLFSLKFSLVETLLARRRCNNLVNEPKYKS